MGCNRGSVIADIIGDDGTKRPVLPIGKHRGDHVDAGLRIIPSDTPPQHGMDGFFRHPYFILFRAVLARRQRAALIFGLRRRGSGNGVVPAVWCEDPVDEYRRLGFHRFNTYLLAGQGLGFKHDV